jgi:WD repeat-containing protein 48
MPAASVNHGKWVLRYLFSNLIDEEIRRDNIYRKSIMENLDQRERLQRSNAPHSIQLPSSTISVWQDPSIRPGSPITPKAINGHNYPPTTPGMVIGVATPGVASPTLSTQLDGHLPPTAEEEPESDKLSSSYSQSRSSGDYFSSSPTPNPLAPFTAGHLKPPVAPGEAHEDKPPQSPSDTDKESHSKESSSLFGKKFRVSFGGKKLGRSSVDAKQPVVADEKAEDSDESKSTETKADLTQDNLLGVVEKIRQGYIVQLQENPGQVVPTALTPSMPNETPVLKPPLSTTVIIQEDRPDSGGVADLYRGTVGSLHEDADLLEMVVPTWLGDLLLLASRALSRYLGR